MLDSNTATDVREGRYDQAERRVVDPSEEGSGNFANELNSGGAKNVKIDAMGVC